MNNTPRSNGQHEKRASSRATDAVLTLNFGDNDNHAHIDGCEPLTEPRVP